MLDRHRSTSAKARVDDGQEHFVWRDALGMMAEALTSVRDSSVMARAPATKLRCRQAPTTPRFEGERS